MTGKPLAIALMGPTASGKTRLAIELAQQMNGEIISVDSALVYRGMDIGTAKPSAAERAEVPHHLIDIVDPHDAYSAAMFAADARRLIAEVRARGRAPLLVGGTMLYAKALFGGLHDLPSADAEVRARLDREAAAIGWPGMHARLAAVDPVTAARLAPNDSQRIQRALEIVELTGEPMSALLARPAPPPDAGAFRLLSLEPADRAWLHRRIAQRFDAMLRDGLLEEVRRLRARGDLDPSLPSIRSVGYRQAWAHLDGECDLDALRERGIAATRQLAKRQLTWLRSMAQRQVIPCDAADATARVVEAAMAMSAG